MRGHVYTNNKTGHYYVVLERHVNTTGEDIWAGVELTLTLADGTVVQAEVTDAIRPGRSFLIYRSYDPKGLSYASGRIWARPTWMFAEKFKRHPALDQHEYEEPPAKVHRWADDGQPDVWPQHWRPRRNALAVTSSFFQPDHTREDIMKSIEEAKRHIMENHPPHPRPLVYLSQREYDFCVAAWAAEGLDFAAPNGDYDVVVYSSLGWRPGTEHEAEDQRPMVIGFHDRLDSPAVKPSIFPPPVVRAERKARPAHQPEEPRERIPPPGRKRLSKRERKAKNQAKQTGKA